jgi:hypothetical protein
MASYSASAIVLLSWCTVQHLLFFLSLSLREGAAAQAAGTNTTIDDTIGDARNSSNRPVYVPASGFWEDATCSGCAIKPDPARAFDGTWTAGTYNPNIPEASIQLTFNGTKDFFFGFDLSIYG